MRCFLFMCRFGGFSSLFSNKAPVPTFGGSLGPFLGKQHHFVQPRSVLKLFVCVCLPSGLKHDVVFLVRPKHYCERHFLPVANAILSFFYPTTYSKNRTLEEFTGTISNVKHTVVPLPRMPVSIGWKSDCPVRNVLTIFAGREGLRSHHYGVKARILVVRFGCWVRSLSPDASWSIHDICESFKGKYIPAPSKGCHLTLRDGELTAFSGRYVEDPGR